MNCETEWPTLIEANHIKPLKKKHNGKKKSSCIKINVEDLFKKEGANYQNRHETNSDCLTQQKNLKVTASNSDCFKTQFRKKIIRPFNFQSDVYNYTIDNNLMDSRQKTFCKRFPYESYMTSTADDIRIEEMYNEFRNGYYFYTDSQIDALNFEPEINGGCKLPATNFKESNPEAELIENKSSTPLDEELMRVRTNVLSYYFSESNLCNDNYLISIMNDNGWVDIDVLLRFPRLLKTKTTLKDVIKISENIRYARFKSINDNNDMLKEANLELSLENESKIRRSDMDNFKMKLVAFATSEKYISQPYYSPYPDYSFRYFLNSIEEKFGNVTFTDFHKDFLIDEGWKEVKPKSRRSRRSECKNEIQTEGNINTHDYLDFEFSSEPNPIKLLNGSNIKRRQQSRKSAERSRSRTISGGSEDELDESNIYILSLRPNTSSFSACKTITNWADVSDSDYDVDDNDSQIPLNSQTKSPNISHRLLAKHPSGDRHPNPDYQPRSKIQEQLREIIYDGLHEWKSSTEIMRRNRKDSSSSTSSDIKVTICQDEKTFKLMQKSFQNYDNQVGEDADAPLLPTILIPIEQKVEGMKKQRAVNVYRFKPLLIDESYTTDYDFLLESSTSSLLNPVLFDPWSPPYVIDQPLNDLLDKLLTTVEYESARRPSTHHGYSKEHQKKSGVVDKAKPTLTEKGKPAVTETEKPVLTPIPKPLNAQASSDAPIDPTRMVKAEILHREVRRPTRACKVGFYPVTKTGPAKNKSKDKTRASDHPIEEFDIGYAYEGRRSSKRHRTISGNTYNQYNDAGYAVTHGIPIPFNDHPSQVLLTQNGFEVKFYNVFRKESLADREKKGVGRSQEMNTLFRFWSFFLRENKSKSMYAEFQKYAWEDAAKKYRYGVECLFRMYTYKLEQKRYFSEEQYQDFQKYVLRDFESGHLYGLEKFWAFLKYSCRRLEVQSSIQRLLDRYQTLEDFRINFTPPQGFHSYKIDHPEHVAVESGIESE